jgi:Gas vesicle synthesis protein GvpL/GvpF
MIHLYAIAEGLGELPAVAGIGGAEIRPRALDDVELVVSEHDGAELEPSEEAVLAHARVVDALAATSSALLPARFTRTFEDEAALDAAVRGRLDDLRQALSRVRGRVELGLRVIGESEDAQPEAASGRAYMEARLEGVARAERLARDLHEPLVARAAESTHSVATKPRFLLSAAYLVAAVDVDGFRGTVAELERAHPELTFVCTGPWPAYSFASAAET